MRRRARGRTLVNLRHGTAAAPYAIVSRAELEGADPTAIELTEGECLAHVLDRHGIGTFKVGDGARDPEDPAAGARGQSGSRCAELEEGPGLAIRCREALKVGGWHCRIECTLTFKLSRAGAHDSRSHDGARVSDMVYVEKGCDVGRLDADVEVEAVEQRA